MEPVGQSERLANLPPEKRQLLLRMLQERTARAAGERSIPRRGDQGPAPLSFAQQRLWFLDRMSPGSPAYNLPSAVRLTGELAIGVMRRALDEIVRRHEVLRARFASGRELPVQVIAPPSETPLPMVDLGLLPAAEAEAEARRLADVEARRPFDLATGPLLRVTLLRLDSEDHVALMTLHHIVSDGWSGANLTRELAALYSAFEAGLPSPLPELPVQYTDYVVWQREWLRGQVLEEHLAYWRQRLAGSPTLLDLPTDRPRPPLQSFRGAICRLAPSRHLAGPLESLGRRTGATPFMILLAAYQALLGRYSRQSDILVGSPIANRTRTEVEHLIGFFANTLVLRADLSRDPSFRELLARVAATTLEAYDHQEVPFEKLVDELGLPRTVSHSPLFQAAFVLQNAPAGRPLRLGEHLRLSPWTVENATAKFDLTLSITLREESLRGGLEYSTDLFDRTTIERFAEHLQRLLEVVLGDPAAPVWELPLLGEPERHQLLLEWREAGEAPPDGPCLHELFEARVDRSPLAVAASFGGERLTYREFDVRANRLARHLRSLGLEPGGRVGILMERGLDLVVAILGVLKAGGAYVPIDPAYPRERMAFMLEDAKVALALVERGLLAALPETGARVVCPDGEDAEAISRQDEGRPAGRSTAALPAYVIYTSGSTGRPKGVLVSHANVTRLFAATADRFEFGERDVWTLFHSIAFDFSVWELWGALLYGGRLVVVPYWVSRSPEATWELLVREEVTVLNQTPSAFRQLARAEERADGGGRTALRWVIFGGEALEIRSLASWFARHGDERPRLVNMYGITETTVHVTHRTLSTTDLGTSVGSAIGRPIPDLSICVLDARLGPQPIGVPGEICVGGAGLAQGYLDRPSFTAERFVPDPFGRQGGERLYRSGDLGRHLPGGEVEYLGRIDQQVKVRGFRIELGEIEAALGEIPGVRESLVLAREDTPGERRLVAYVVAGGADRPRVDELRRRLKERLPEHMVPATFVTLESLPLTPQGKVDRRALPAPGLERPALETDYAVPETMLEEVLAGIFAQVTGVERVGVHDNFFALGGDSIRSVQVVGLARERGLALDLPQIFQHQTVHELARRLELSGTGAVPAPRTRPFELVSTADRALLPAGLEDAYPLTLLQAGMLYHASLDPESAFYHNVDSYRIRCALDREALQTAVDRAVARHAVLRTSFDLTTFSEPLQLVHAAARLAVGVEDLRHLPAGEQEAAVDAYLAREIAGPFDISRPPLLRFHLQRLTDEIFQFTLTEFHPIFDGWSLHSTLAEIFNTYFALLDREPLPDVMPPALAFRDFVALERAALQSEAMRSFWLARLEGCPRTAVPRLYETRDVSARSREKYVNVALPVDVADGLKRLARAAAVPLKSVLLTAHLKVLSLLTGGDDVVTGLSSHGRLEELGGEDVRGLFLNNLPFRHRLRAGTWSDLVRDTFRAELELLPYRRYPMPDLQKRWGQRPLFETAFNFVHFHVIEGLARSGRLEVLGFKKFEKTNITFLAGFRLDASSGGVGLELDFNPRELSPAEVATFGRYYRQVLAAMASQPAEPHDARSFLSDAERHQFLVEWNDSRTAWPLDRWVHELIELQARRIPDAVAVAAADRQLSYAGLEAVAARLVARLRTLGVGPETRVGLFLERSPEMVAALLGVLKTGGAYVPLDLSHPTERLRFLLEDSQAEILLTTGDLAARLPEGAPRAIRLDRESGVGAAPAAAAPSTVGPETLAYVIYTSGSTGRPKGVMISHSGLLNYLRWCAEAYQVGEGLASPVHSPLGFDLTVTSLLAPLTVGGTVVLVADRPGVEGLGEALAESGREWGLVKLTPAHLDVLGQLLGEQRSPVRVRDLVVGGEALRGESLAFWAREAPDVRVVNEYGPTEATVGCCTWTCTAGSAAAGPLPIGRPIGNARLYLLGPAFWPVPAGAPGEIFIGGAGLARGYLARPALTAERFVPDPFGGGAGSRLYRTGDLARHRPDGHLEFLGRRDRQVKVRGHRIEPGEIEMELAAHPAVREAVVVLREGFSAGLVAYVVPHSGASPVARELREALQARLPEHMLPSALVLLESMPLTPSGKVDHRALPAPDQRNADDTYAAPRTSLEEAIAALWREALNLEKVGRDDNFFELGGHSLLLLQMRRRLRELAGRKISMVDMFRHPTVASLASFLEAGREPEVAEPPASVQPSADVSAVAPAAPEGAEPALERGAADIAVIGLSGRFPGADCVAAFWRNLREGVESISFFSDKELRQAGVPEEVLARPGYVKAKGVLAGAEWFDASFFGFSPREAEITDPQQRVFLECAWEALENAGYVPESYPGRIGVFAGVSANSYWRNLLGHPELVESVGGFQLLLSNDKDYLPTRTSYKLDLTGPSINVQTACSTSLVAVHLACRSLRGGEADIALAGGASIRFPQTAGYSYQEGGVVSPDGHCRAFDVEARGTVDGSGVGVVLLKRLADALADGDTIHAVIKGSAVNNDGSRKLGYTAPSADGQAAVLRAALADAGVDSATISYIETHGTGTPLGDPIEIAALADAYGRPGSPGVFRALGSVKTNIGHLDAAAGVAGLIKTVLALEHRTLPPSLHFRTPNPEIDFAGGGLRVVTEPLEWAPGEGPRRAGVSSFGIGGTNSHVVLEEAPPVPAPAPSRPWQLLVLSARTPTALDAGTAALADFLEREEGVCLADLAYTLAVGRRAFAHRRIAVCRDRDCALEALRTLDGGRVFSRGDHAPSTSAAFLFPGQGAQYAGMGRELYAVEAVFREQVDLCARLLEPHLGLDLRRIFFPDREAEAGTRPELDQTRFVQPALFVVQYALARLWMEWGVRPEVMVGHSVGEYVAACLAGVFSLEDALALIAERGRLMQELPAGTMVSVALPAEVLRPRLSGALSLAAVNGPSHCVVSGPEDAVAALERELDAEGAHCRRLRTSHAFHSPMMEPIVGAFAERVGRLRLRPPAIPFLSNLTGSWIRSSEATDPAYWAQHLRRTVRFAENLGEVLAEPARLLLEVGPGRSLGTLAARHPAAGGREIVSSLAGPGREEAETASLLIALGRLWLAGIPIDWRAVYARESRRRIPAPTYPFERQRFFVAPASGASAPRRSAQRRALDDWFHLPSWKKTVPPVATAGDPAGGSSPWLVFCDPCGLGARLAQRLEEDGREVIRVTAGDRFSRRGAGDYELAPGDPDGYRALFEDLRSADRLPGLVYHLWSVTLEDEPPLGPRERLQELGFYSLLFLAQSFGEYGFGKPMRWRVVSNGVQAVTGEEAIDPDKATLLGPCRIIPRELANIECRSIDLVLGARSRWDLHVGRLLGEAAGGRETPMVAYRGGYRWVEAFEPVRLSGAAADAAPLRRRGVYLITGGTGGMGLEIGAHLARTVGARLVLVGRTPVPDRREWPAWIEAHGEADRMSRRIRRLQAIEDSGGEVLTVAADVTDAEQMRSAVAEARRRFGAVHGIVHAAGVPPRGTIPLKTREMAAEVLAPKLAGTWVLAEICAEMNPDFLVLCSSLSSLVSQVGRVDYCAANAFLDAFAHRQLAAGGVPTVAIDWDTWRDAGMAFEEAVRLGRDPRNGEPAMSSEEGAEVFARALRAGVPQLAVSIDPLDAVYAAGLQPAVLEQAPPAQETQRPARSHPRPRLSTPYVAPAGEVERAIAEIWGDLLGIREIGIHDNFFELGGDSVVTIQVIARLKRAGLELTPKQVFELQTIAELARVAGTGPRIEAEQGAVTGELPLTPIQRWFLEQDQPDPHHWNQAVLLEARSVVDPALLDRLVRGLLLHADALRLRFFREGQGWRQVNAPLKGETPFVCLDLSAVPPELARPAIDRAVAAVHASLDLSRGPLLRAALLRTGGPELLLVVAHHLAVDAVSWRILLEDLATGYLQLSRGEALSLPAKTTSFKHWAHRLQELAASYALAAELEHWLDPRRRTVGPLPVDRHAGANTVGSMRTIAQVFGGEETRSLLDVAQTFRAQVPDVLLTAVVLAFRRWTGAGTLLLDLEGHGREPIFDDVDLSRTVGWFTTLFPVLLEVETADPAAALRAVKEQLRAVPGQGLGYGLLRYMDGAPAWARELQTMPAAEVSFLYLGQQDAGRSTSSDAHPFVPAKESSGPARSPRGLRSHLLEISGGIVAGELRLAWAYSAHLHLPSSIERLAESFREILSALVAAGREPAATDYIPSDFPQAGLTQDDLDDLLSELAFHGE